MTYTPVIPVSGETLGGTRDRIRTNFELIQSTFSENHVPIGSLNGGKHANIQTVDQSGHPSTAANEPAIYGTSVVGTALGVLDYSRGESDAVPTPITSLHSPNTPIVLANGATTNLLDFTGIPRAIVQMFAMNETAPVLVFSNTIFWNGTVFLNLPIGVSFQALASGNVLQLKNQSGSTMNDVYWTLNLQRVS